MGHILIANIDNEDMLADRSGLTYEFRCHSATAASKHAWFAEAGDIVVLPELMSTDMQEYMAQVKGISPDSVTFIAPSHESVEVCPLGAKELLEGECIDRLKDAMTGGQHWELRPYHYDRASAILAKRLGLADQGSGFSFLQQGGADLFNNKRSFRSLAAGRGVQVAKGDVVSTLSQFITTLDDLIDETGAVIVKQNRHSGALGNIIVAATRDIDGQGASDVLFVNDHCPLSTAAKTIWERLAIAGGKTLVVEVYYPVTTVCYAEFLVTGRRDVPIFLNLGKQRMEPLFAGFEIPGQLPAYQQARFVSGATELVALAQDLGFTGLIDVDGIITCDGEVIFCEANGRYGGCSHVHHLAKRFLGHGYGDTHTILTRNGVRAPFFPDVLRLVEDQDLNLSVERPEGILVTAEDTGRTGTLDYLIASESRRRAYDIELWLLDLLRNALDLSQPGSRISAHYH